MERPVTHGECSQFRAEHSPHGPTPWHHHELRSGKFIIFASFGQRAEERNKGFHGGVSSNIATVGCFCSSALSVHSAALSTSPQRRW